MLWGGSALSHLTEEPDDDSDDGPEGVTNRLFRLQAHLSEVIAPNAQMLRQSPANISHGRPLEEVQAEYTYADKPCHLYEADSQRTPRELAKTHQNHWNQRQYSPLDLDSSWGGYIDPDLVKLMSGAIFAAIIGFLLRELPFGRSVFTSTNLP